MKTVNSQSVYQKEHMPYLGIIWLRSINNSDKEFENLIKYIKDMAVISGNYVFALFNNQNKIFN